MTHEQIIAEAVKLALPIMRRRNKGTLRKPWVVRFDGRRNEVYKNALADEFAGGTLLLHREIYELYSPFPASTSATRIIQYMKKNGVEVDNRHIGLITTLLLNMELLKVVADADRKRHTCRRYEVCPDVRTALNLRAA